MSVSVEEILRNDMVFTLSISPKQGGLPIRDAVIYGFTPYGYPNKKIDYVHSERVRKNLHITLSVDDAENQILQILAINQLGGMAEPYHWAPFEPQYSVIDILPDLDVSETNRGIFFQLQLLSDWNATYSRIGESLYSAAWHLFFQDWCSSVRTTWWVDWHIRGRLLHAFIDWSD
mgnify:CR=1 FL=1